MTPLMFWVITVLGILIANRVIRLYLGKNGRVSLNWLPSLPSDVSGRHVRPAEQVIVAAHFAYPGRSG